MSEYQFVTFQAVDGPLSDTQLEFAQRQSSRADVSRWSLSVEYEYSSFRGDINGLLQNGYDVFLQYTNYGSREVRVRLQCGMPFTEEVWQKYVDGEHLNWKADTSGTGGILSLHPFHESGDRDEFEDPQHFVDALIHLRDRLLRGDLRALYALWLCAADDDYNDPAKMIEPPVPHGIAAIEKQYGPLLDFFGVDPLLFVAAGSGVSDVPPDAAQDPAVRWVSSLDEQSAKEMLLQFLSGDTASAKANALVAMRHSQTVEAWPTADVRRSYAELLEAASALRAEENAKKARKAAAKAKLEAEKAERARADRMKEMLKDPNKWLRESERLVEYRGTESYQAAAEILHDLREAIGGEEGGKVARRHAAHLAKKYPTLNKLKSSLRKRGLLD